LEDFPVIVEGIEFPRRLLYHTQADIEKRRETLEKWLQRLMQHPEIANTIEFNFFLEFKQHVM
jgi:hypothetical protein